MRETEREKVSHSSKANYTPFWRHCFLWKKKRRRRRRKRRRVVEEEEEEEEEEEGGGGGGGGRGNCLETLHEKRI